MVMFLPMMVINQAVLPGLVKKWGRAAKAPAAAPNPNLRPVRRVRPNPRPVPNRDPQPADGGNAARPGFAPQGFRPQREPASRPEAEADRIYHVTLTYASFQGQGSVEDSMQSVVKGLPGYVEDSLDIDEDAKTIRFQHRGRIPPPDGSKVFKLLAQDGFAAPRMQMSSKGPRKR